MTKYLGLPEPIEVMAECAGANGTEVVLLTDGLEFYCDVGHFFV